MAGKWMKRGTNKTKRNENWRDERGDIKVGRAAGDRKIGADEVEDRGVQEGDLLTSTDDEACSGIIIQLLRLEFVGLKAMLDNADAAGLLF